MNLGLNTAAAALDDPQTDRLAGREVLSLALIDSRNHLLQRLAQSEGERGERAAQDPGQPALRLGQDPSQPALRLGQDPSQPALRLAVQAGWYAEHWINGFVQRGRGEAADPRAVRLGGVEPLVAAWREGRQRPTSEAVRAYLQQTLEDTLDLLAQADDSDTGLHFYRLALRHEDRLAEGLALLALQHGQAQGGAPTRPERAPLCLPAQRWRLGSERGGCVPEGERWAHALDLPEFEIDAQVVSWARYAEFALDGGYDRQELWTRAGWAWLQQDGRRAPLGVAQFAGGVLLERGGRLLRAPAQQAAVGVSRHEAEAWCAWAGRRLPTEPEWELAACTAATRGFVWGDVLEWVTGSARAWPGHAPVPGDLDPVPPDPGASGPGLLAGPPRPLPGVQRGACWMARTRARHPRARRFAALGQATMTTGFRSCTF